MIDPRLRKDVETAESCELRAYKDSRGFWTIGWGHLITPQPPSDPGTVWTQQQADDQLDKDLEFANGFATTTPEWPFLDTPCRQNAVTELCFSMRRRWLLFVNTRAAIRVGDWQGAHDGLLKSAWEAEVHETRADRIADYLLTGEYNGS